MLLMKNYFDEIKLKLKKQVEIEELVIVDNSHKHKGHKFFSPEKFHLHLKIKSLYLNSISRVNAQKIIMKTLEEDLKNRIHALEISIEQ
jgi:BolA protein